MAAGIRVFNVPATCSEKEIKIYFTKPDNGGGPIKEVYYPLHQGDAVVVYEHPETADKVLQYKHVMKGKTLDVYLLPVPQAFTAVEATLDPSVAALIQSSEEVRDELQYNRNIELCTNVTGAITGVRGNWYLLEWVSAYIERMARRQRYPSRDDMVNEKRGTSPMQLDDHIVSMPHSPENMTGIEGKSATGGANVTNTVAGDVKIQAQKQAAYDLKILLPDDDHNQLVDYSEIDQTERNSLLTGGDKTETLDDDKGLHRLSNLTIESDQIPHSITIISGNADDIKSLDFRYGPLTVSVYTGYITMAETDAIVNAANSSLSHVGGVAGAIADAAGYEMKRQCEEYIRKSHMIPTTHVMHTCAGGKISLKVKYVMHAVGPMYSPTFHTTSSLQLMQTFLNCMKYGNDVLKVESVAMPVISSGIFGCPLEVCVRSFFDAVLLFVCEHMSDTVHLREVHLVNNNSDNTAMTVLQLKDLISQETQLMVLEAQQKLQKINLEDIDYIRVADQRFDFDREPTSTNSSYNFTNLPAGKVYESGSSSGLNRTTGAVLSDSSPYSRGWTSGSKLPAGKVYESESLSGLNRTTGTGLLDSSSGSWTSGSKLPAGKVYESESLSGLNKTTGTGLLDRSSGSWTSGSSFIASNEGAKAGTSSAPYYSSLLTGRNDHSGFTMGNKANQFETDTTDRGHTRSGHGSDIKYFSIRPDQDSTKFTTLNDNFSNQGGARNETTSRSHRSGPPTTSYRYSWDSKLPR